MTDAAQKQDYRVAHAGGRSSGDAPGGKHRRVRQTAAVAVVFASLTAGSAAEVHTDRGDANTNLIRVFVTVAHRQNISTSLSETGTITAQIQSAISFQTSGRVTERLVEVGQHVTADQVLARLDSTEQRSDVASAVAGLDSANAQLRETQTTFHRNECDSLSVT